MSYLELAKKIEDGLRQTDDPVLSPDQWYPPFRDFHHKAVSETPNLDFCWLREHRPDLYGLLKAKENEIDALGSARLSEVMAVMREWRTLLLHADFEQKGFEPKQTA